MNKSILERFNAWINEPIIFPSWLGYLLIAVLACFLNTFILIGVFKSAGIQQQFIEARGQIEDLQGSINPIVVKLEEINKVVNDLESKQHSHKKRFILF